MTGLHDRTSLLAGIDGPVLVDIDDTIIEVHGHAKQGSGYGYSGVRGLNALITTVTTGRRCTGDRWAAAAQRRVRVRARSCPDGGRHRGRRAHDCGRTESAGLVLLRGDSAFYGHLTVSAALRGGAQVSITVRLDPKVNAAIAAIGERCLDAHRIHRRGLRRDHRHDGSPVPRSPRSRSPHSAPRRPTSRFGAGWWCAASPTSTTAAMTGQATLFDTWRFHAFFTTTDLDTVTADKTHRGHAIIEQVHADLKDSALAHLPSGRFTANAAWLVLAVMAFNLTRAAATLTGPRAGQGQNRDHPPHPGHGPGTDRVLGPPPDPAPTAELAMGNGVEHPVRQAVWPISPDHRLTAGTPPAPRYERPSGTTRHRGRAIAHAHTAPHPGSRPHNRNRLRTASRSVNRGLV